MHLFYIPLALLISAASFPLWMVLFGYSQLYIVKLMGVGYVRLGYKLHQALEYRQNNSRFVILLQDYIPSIVYIIVYRVSPQ